MGLKTNLTENLGVKLIALVVALFIWFNASGQKQVVWMKMIPISLENLPDSLVVTGHVPREAEVSIAGTKRQLMLMGLKRLKMSVDLTGAVPGRQRVSLTPRQIHLPSGFDYRNVRILEPVSLDLRLEPLVSKRVKVTPATTGAIKSDLFLLDGSLSVSPSWVSVKGPKSTIDRVNSVTTEPIDLSKVKQSSDREIAIDTQDGRFQCDPDKVIVSVRVDRRGERVFANVPPTILLDSDDYTADVEPTTVAVTLVGPQAVLDTLRYSDVSVLLNLGGVSESRRRMAPEVILPPGVELSQMSVDSLTVRIEKRTDKSAP
ncbi:MAG: CdaR family protein [Candidatus Latescibacterota bacterium]|jgi:YbbR domain-containing protein